MGSARCQLDMPRNSQPQTLERAEIRLRPEIRYGEPTAGNSHVSRRLTEGRGSGYESPCLVSRSPACGFWLLQSIDLAFPYEFPPQHEAMIDLNKAKCASIFWGTDMVTHEISLRSLVEKWLGPTRANTLHVSRFGRTASGTRFVCVEMPRVAGPLTIAFFHHEDGAWRVFPPCAGSAGRRMYLC